MPCPLIDSVPTFAVLIDPVPAGTTRTEKPPSTAERAPRSARLPVALGQGRSTGPVSQSYQNRHDDQRQEDEGE